MSPSTATQGHGVRADAVVPGEASSRRGALPPDLRRILIVGAGGFGREVLRWARDAWPLDCHRIAGFLSADADVLDGCDCGVGIIGAPDSHQPEIGDMHLLAIGVPYARRRVAESLIARGAGFLTLVHPTAIVAASASIGEGSIICPYAIVSDHASVGRFVALNYHASLGHDASAGDFAVLSPYAALGGDAHVGADVFLGLNSSVGPGVSVGSGSKVSANSASLHDAPEKSLIYGVPGRVVPRVDLSGAAP